MYCSKCGHQLSENDIFCPYCGTQRMLDNGVASSFQNQENMSIRDILFSKKGRLNRASYIKVNVIIIVVSFFLQKILDFLFGPTSEVTSISGLLFFILLLVGVVIDYFINIKRLRDIGHGEGLAILFAVIHTFYVINPRFDLIRYMPLISTMGWIWIFIFLYLIFKKGRNEYGDDLKKSG